MSDFTLSDGREITFDLSKMTYGQWLGLYDTKESDERPDETIARVAGLSNAEVKDLPFLDFKKLWQALIIRARQPLSDPNA